MTTLDQLGENAILSRLLTSLPSHEDLIVGPGDDCAVIRRNDEWDSLYKTDVIVEGVHFTPDTPPELIGRKALARALSDIAAMGGIPEHALVTLLIHPKRTFEQLEGIYAGLTALAREWGVSIAGGETSSLPMNGLVINVSLLGRVPAGTAVLRSTARPGDLIAVTGELGDSFNSGHHLTFIPRIREGIALREQGIATSMMDLSDGLSTDLGRLCNASGVNFVLNDDKLPCKNGSSRISALNNGEDYELLFTLKVSSLPKLQQLITHTLNETKVSVIGRITPASLHQDHNFTCGWEHFVSP